MLAHLSCERTGLTGMTTLFCNGRRSGFSILEILVAMGLLALIATGLLTLFPVIGTHDRENAAETRAWLIASGVMDALTSDEEEPLRLAKGMSNEMPVWETLPRTAVIRNIAYTESCSPLFPLDLEGAAQPVADRKATAVITLAIGKNDSTPGMLAAEVAVAEPASAPADRRTVRKFVRLIPATAPIR